MHGNVSLSPRRLQQNEQRWLGMLGDLVMACMCAWLDEILARCSWALTSSDMTSSSGGDFAAERVSRTASPYGDMISSNRILIRSPTLKSDGDSRGDMSMRLLCTSWAGDICVLRHLVVRVPA